MKKIRILIADDHAVVRNGLRMLLNGRKGFTVVAEASNGEETIALATKHKPDVAIIDISMPATNGIEVTRVLRRSHPTVKILILTIHENEGYVQQMIREGASGYLLKNAEKEELFSAVRAVAAGEQFFSPAVSSLMVGNFIRRARNRKKQSSNLLLTRRETEVLQLIARGLTNRQIAEKLVVSVSTVNTHRTNLMQKLDIHDTARLVRYAIEQGIDAEL